MRRGLALCAALTSAGCASSSTSTPAAPTSAGTAVVALASFAATLETTTIGVIDHVTAQLAETGGQAGATINTVTLIYRNGFVSGSMIYTPPSATRLASSGTLNVGPIAVVDNSGNVATEIGANVSYTDDSGHTASVSGSGPLPVLKFTLVGFVRDTGTGQGISSATVQVTSGPNASASVVADSNGQYAFPALQAGTFGVQAQASGYVASSQSVTLLAGSETDFQLAVVAQPAAGGATRRFTGRRQR
jgi:hypothetical protein